MPENLDPPRAAATPCGCSLTDHLLSIARAGADWLMAEIEDDAPERLVVSVSPGFPGRPRFAADERLVAWTDDATSAHRFASGRDALAAIETSTAGDDYLGRNLHLRAAPALNRNDP